MDEDSYGMNPLYGTQNGGGTVNPTYTPAPYDPTEHAYTMPDEKKIQELKVDTIICVMIVYV